MKECTFKPYTNEEGITIEEFNPEHFYYKESQRIFEAKENIKIVKIY